MVKKVTKEISRLFSKKNCTDVTGGDAGKKKKKPEKEKDGRWRLPLCCGSADRTQERVRTEGGVTSAGVRTTDVEQKVGSWRVFVRGWGSCACVSCSEKQMDRSAVYKNEICLFDLITDTCS